MLELGQVLAVGGICQVKVLVFDALIGDFVFDFTVGLVVEVLFVVVVIVVVKVHLRVRETGLVQESFELFYELLNFITEFLKYLFSVYGLARVVVLQFGNYFVAELLESDLADGFYLLVLFFFQFLLEFFDEEIYFLGNFLNWGCGGV